MAAVRGEVWSASSDDVIKKDDRIEVISLSGLQIKVKKKEVV
jgi:membrane-bound ClpP family serine protease